MTKRYLSTWHYRDEGLSDMPIVRNGPNVQIAPTKTLEELEECTRLFIALEDNPNILILGVIATTFIDIEGGTTVAEPIRVRRRSESEYRRI